MVGTDFFVGYDVNAGAMVICLPFATETIPPQRRPRRPFSTCWSRQPMIRMSEHPREQPEPQGRGTSACWEPSELSREQSALGWVSVCRAAGTLRNSGVASCPTRKRDCARNSRRSLAKPASLGQTRHCAMQLRTRSGRLRSVDRTATPEFAELCAPLPGDVH